MLTQKSRFTSASAEADRFFPKLSRDGRKSMQPAVFKISRRFIILLIGICFLKESLEAAFGPERRGRKVMAGVHNAFKIREAMREGKGRMGAIPSSCSKFIQDTDL
tara:strand:+ start:346 stop:663 length:318 start_codon:yes stop_codon:yes gene_type:complete